jgi:hypothetical protein
VVVGAAVLVAAEPATVVGTAVVAAIVVGADVEAVALVGAALDGGLVDALVEGAAVEGTVVSPCAFDGLGTPSAVATARSTVIACRARRQVIVGCIVEARFGKDGRGKRSHAEGALDEVSPV